MVREKVIEHNEKNEKRKRKRKKNMGHKILIYISNPDSLIFIGCFSRGGENKKSHYFSATSISKNTTSNCGNNCVSLL
jgi:hypothetical protein